METPGISYLVYMLKDRIRNNDSTRISNMAAVTGLPPVISDMIGDYIAQDLRVLDFILAGFKGLLVESKKTISIETTQKSEFDSFSVNIKKFNINQLHHNDLQYFNIRLPPPWKRKCQTSFCPCIFEIMFELSDVCKFTGECIPNELLRIIKGRILEKIREANP